MPMATVTTATVSETVSVAHEVKLSSPDRVLFPEDGITKGDLFDYYERGRACAPPAPSRPAVHDEALPRGDRGEGFFQKQAPKGMPSWIPTRRFTTHPREGGAREVDFPLVNSREALLWMVQMHCIDMNAWYSRVDKPGRPDYVVFDLDPPDEPDGFEQAIEVAHLVGGLLRGGRAAGVRQDERRRRDPRPRADPAAGDVRGDVRLRGVRPRDCSRPGTRGSSRPSG